MRRRGRLCMEATCHRPVGTSVSLPRLAVGTQSSGGEPPAATARSPPRLSTVAGHGAALRPPGSGEARRRLPQRDRPVARRWCLLRAKPRSEPPRTGKRDHAWKSGVHPPGSFLCCSGPDNAVAVRWLPSLGQALNETSACGQQDAWPTVLEDRDWAQVLGLW